MFNIMIVKLIVISPCNFESSQVIPHSLCYSAVCGVALFGGGDVW